MSKNIGVHPQVRDIADRAIHASPAPTEAPP